MKNVLSWLIVLMLPVSAQVVQGAERITLSPGNYDEYAPAGRDARTFFGDWVLRNDRIVAAVADPGLMSGRSASRWSIADVGGALISLTRRDQPNDMLRAYYPSVPRLKPDAPHWQHLFTDPAEAYRLPGREPQTGRRVELRPGAYEVENGRSVADLEALSPHLRPAPQPRVDVRCVLEDGWDYLLVEADYHNPTSEPFALPRENVLRADGTFEAGIGFDGRLFYAYDPWWSAAYGVLADEHRLRISSRHRGYHLEQLGGLRTLGPGHSHTVTRRLIPGADLFEVRAIAADLLGLEQHELELRVRDDDGPVANARVTARRDNELYAVGRTGEDGTLTRRMPVGIYTLQVESQGRPAKTATVELTGNLTRQLHTETAGRVEVRIRDGEARAIPAKVRFRGLDGTDDPMFFPETGRERVRNLAYSADGSISVELAPGRYEILVTYGNEYSAHLEQIDLERGQSVRVDATLSREVDSDGWISIDLHNHSAVTGVADRFYVYPYTRCPVVDGESLADPMGRVLNLLAEQVQFAVATEHNQVYSYEPYVRELGVGHLLATAPGIGLTAGRRHTLNHQNIFPMPYRRGAQDGGIPQRPQHIQQLSWARDLFDRSEKLIVISQPKGAPLNVLAEMDALDVHDLLPIVYGEPIDGRDNRILDWIQQLRTGYRLPAVVGSNAYDNFHGSGGLRTYVPMPGNDLRDLDPLAVARAVRRGAAIMTTGPFMEVTMHADGVSPAQPGEERYVPDGRARLQVRVQTPGWIDVDRVQVLVNGERPPELNFTRATHPDFFKTPPVSFDRYLDLELDRDAFVIVVASGSGPNMRHISGPDNLTVPHVAVNNPIYVDTGDKGYEPHSPFDDQVAVRLDWLRPMLAADDAPPGVVGLRLDHRGDSVARDTVELVVFPDTDMRIIGPVEQSYELEPGQTMELRWEVAPTESFLATHPAPRSTYMNAPSFGVSVGRSGKFPGRSAARRHAEIDNPITAMPGLESAVGVAAHLAGEAEIPLTGRRGVGGGVLRWAVAGDQLAVHLVIEDHRVKPHDILLEGSCVEIFAAMPGRGDPDGGQHGGYHPVRQVYLTPGDGTSPPGIHLRDGGEQIVSTDAVQVVTDRTGEGYEMQALIPLALLGVDLDLLQRHHVLYGQRQSAAALETAPMAGRFLLECRVSAFNPDGALQRSSVFRAGAPHGYHFDFGRMRIVGPVQASVGEVSGLSAGEDAAAGRVRLDLRNTSRQALEDKLRLRIEPPVASFVDDSTIHYRLEPGAEASYELDVRLDDHAASLVDIIVERSSSNQVVTTFGTSLKVRGRMLPRLAMDELDRIESALSRQPAYPLNYGDEGLGEVRFALAGEDLVLMVDVVDHRVRPHEVPWRGSCVEVFGSGGGGIGQVFLVPGADQPAQGYHRQNNRQVPVSDIGLQSIPREDGYRMVALIPLSRLNLREAAEELALELQLTTHDKRGAVRRTTVFGSEMAYQDDHRYGRFR